MLKTICNRKVIKNYVRLTGYIAFKYYGKIQFIQWNLLLKAEYCALIDWLIDWLLYGTSAQKGY